jgi:hypothetical protein
VAILFHRGITSVSVALRVPEVTWVSKGSLKVHFYLGSPEGTRDSNSVVRIVGQSYIPYMQAHLTFAAKDVAKKHDIPFAIILSESVPLKPAWGIHRPVQAKFIIFCDGKIMHPYIGIS